MYTDQRVRNRNFFSPFFLESENTKSQTPKVHSNRLDKGMHDSRHVVCRGFWSPTQRPDSALNALLRKYSKIINRRHPEGTIQKEYNFALDNLQLSYEDLEEQLRTIF